MQIQLKNSEHLTRSALYYFWRDMFLEGNADKIVFKETSSQFPTIIVSPTSSFYYQERIQEIARQWKDTVKGFTPEAERVNKSTIPDIPSYLPDLEKDVTEYATRNKISIIDLMDYYCQIYAVFSGVEEVKISLVSDPEIENYKKIRFYFKIKSSVEMILEKEVEFNKVIRKTISRESRIHFVLIPQII